MTEYKFKGTKKIEDKVLTLYNRIENGVLSRYKKIENAFVNKFLDKKED